MQNIPTCPPKLLLISPGLLLIVIVFAAGICWAETLPMHAGLSLSVPLFLVCLIYVLHKRKPKQHNILSHILLALLFFFLGLQQAKIHLTPPASDTHIYNLIEHKQTVSLGGVLLKYPSVINASSDPESRLLMQVETLLQSSGSKEQIQMSTSASGLALLSLKGLLPENIKPGDHFLARTSVSRVSTYSTPGSLNYKKHLENQAIFITGWIQSPINVIKLHSGKSSLLASRLTSIKYLPELIRYHIADFLNRTLSQPARGLYKAILIGDRSDVPAAVIENFTRAGCIHILAISGMHMGLLALVTIALLTWVLKRSTWLLLHIPVVKVAVSIALLPLLVYALIAGFNIPVQRALLMTIVFILAILSDRPENLLNHILIAALLILVWQPGALFTASFQLSFSAVIFIALVYPLLSRLLFQENQVVSSHSVKPAPAAKPSPAALIHRLPAMSLKWLLAGIALTTAAMLGTSPLLLFHFNRLSLVAPFTNLLVEPLICFWSLVIGLVASLCIPFFPVLAKFLFVAGGYGLIAAERICAFFAAIPYASLWGPTPALSEIMLTYLFLFSAVVALHLAGRQKRHSLILSLFFLCTLVAVPAISNITKPSTFSASVTFLDVGHGSSILLQLPQNKNILIDGGGGESDRFNIGERVIGPFLWHQKLSDLDAVVITHPHADHYNGLPYILTRFHPKELWINSDPGHDSEYKELLELAGKLGIKIITAKTDDILFQADSTRLLCLHSGLGPTDQTDRIRQKRSTNSNDASIVLRLETADKSFLFPADISGTMAETLVKEGKNLQADVLMAPHHGSSSSMNHDFIKKVAPGYIAISAGRNSPFNFPAKSFTDLQQRGIEVLTTGRDGTITFTMKDGEILISRYQVN